jgi:phosphatidylglycerophosphatase A
MLFLPCSWLAIGLGFIFFRLFDILKPYPIRQTERIRGGFGVVIDDLVAGLYAYAVVRIILLIPGLSASTFTVPG